MGEVLHFSEDPSIGHFVPHVAATAQQPGAYVWAVDELHAPSYWFPRECPRAMAWRTIDTADEDLGLLSPAVDRVHVVEYGWLDAIRSSELWAYRFMATDFEPFGDGHAHVATTEVTPLGAPVPVGDLLALHADAGIELRCVSNVWPWWNEVIASTLGFSGIRLRNAVGGNAQQ